MADDFSNAKRGPVVATDPSKQRITIRLDADVIAHFKGVVNEQGGGNYQTLINQALRQYIEEGDKSLEKRLRKIIREELKKAS